MNEPQIEEVVVGVEVSSYEFAEMVSRFISALHDAYCTPVDGTYKAEFRIKFPPQKEIPPRGKDTLAWGIVRDAMMKARDWFREHGGE